MTERQKDVLDVLLKDGASNKRIATELGISVSTVKDHLKALFDHFGCDTRAACVLAASRNGR